MKWLLLQDDYYDAYVVALYQIQEITHWVKVLVEIYLTGQRHYVPRRCCLCIGKFR